MRDRSLPLKSIVYCFHSPVSFTLSSLALAVSKNRLSRGTTPSRNVTVSPPFSPRAQKVNFFAPVKSHPPGRSPQSPWGDCQTTPPHPCFSVKSARMQVLPAWGFTSHLGSNLIALAFPIQPTGT